MPGVENFDIHVDEAPHSPNLKSTNFAMLLELGNTNPDIMALYWDIIIEQSPLQQSIINKIQQRYQQKSQPDPQVEAMKEANLFKTQMEGLQKQMDALLKHAKAQVEAENPDIEQDKMDLQALDQAANLVQTHMQMKQKNQEKNQ